MNLKESFRYQNFLDSMMQEATYSIRTESHGVMVTKKHLKSNANPDADDVEEEVVTDDFFANDDVIKFITYLIDERQKLTEAIGKAKASINFDIDAAIETNKFRQSAHSAIKRMLQCSKASKSVAQGRDYKFNAEGNQTAYYYDIEVTKEEAFDRDKSKSLMRSIISESDKTSAEIDTAIINTQVDYTPMFDVNESFDDVMTAFLEQ